MKMEAEMKRATVAIALCITTGLASASDAVVGDWRTEVGTTATISPCGRGYCIRMKTGNHAGKHIGSFSRTDEGYYGEITEPDSGKTFTGTLSVTGNIMKMRGCAMKVVCLTQTWNRL
jgi:uncharacterized protein (DUF2147 family)